MVILIIESLSLSSFDEGLYGLLLFNVDRKMSCVDSIDVVVIVVGIILYHVNCECVTRINVMDATPT